DAEHAGNWKASGPGGLVLWQGVAATFTRPRKPAEGVCWYSGKPFGDYVLRMEFKLDTPQANSGVLIACPALESNSSPSGRGNALEIDIAGYDIKKLGTASIAWSKLPNSLPMKRDDWNQYEITVTGAKCQVRLNGREVNGYDAGRSLGGYIALQHRWSDGEVRFRNVHIKELAPFRPDAAVASAGALPVAGPSPAAGKLPPEADGMMRKLRAFATERRASLRQSINTGRRQLAGAFRTEAKGEQRETFAAEARRVELLDAGKELLDEDGVQACVWKSAPDFLGNWKDAKTALVFTFNPNGKGSSNERGPLQWRCLDDDPQRLLVVHWGDDWVNLGHFSKGTMNSINWNGLRFQRNKIAESTLLSRPGMEWISRTVRQEHEAADKTAASIEEKAQAVREWLRAQLKTAPAPMLSAALAQVDAVSTATASRPGPEEQRNPEGVWVAGGHRLEFKPGGELIVDRSIAGKWIWATDDFQKTTVAFCYDEGVNRLVGLARQSSKDEDLLRVYLLAGSGLWDARRDRSSGSPVGVPAAETVSAKKMLMGQWTWHGVGKPVRIEFLPDGKVINPVADNGSWKQVGSEEDRCFEFHWNNGTDITAVLSEDGLGIDAVQADGFKIKGVKIVKP
ncbi:MAG: secreted glycosyl hydrolase, partial [Verrucomicrobiales bacterium]|nr:secreted glycosyl hydrolase [Verrucomicrobiales bacterium]